MDSQSVSFGPFTLYPAARLIENEGAPLALGDRALDILIVLVERAGEIVSHKELISRVWRGLVVHPGNLRVHITGLRKAIGDGIGNTRYIANVPGQGYSFVAQIRRGTSGAAPTPLPEYPCGAAKQRLVLPPVLSRMVGREDSVRIICADVITDRFVTIIGPGGMGKTTVAISVAHALLEEFADAVCFVDVSTVAEAKLVAATIASTLGLTVQGDKVLPALLKCLRTLRVLLVLDNCEHVIDATAELAEQIFREAPAVHILATSREALRAEGEHAFWLPPLGIPPPDNRLTAAEALTFPAVRLFVERATAGGGRFELTDATASLVVEICARLDGIALAIEIAAARVGTHGLSGTAHLLKRQLGLQWPGRRTAPARHRTVQALLDWSYQALTAPERHVLNRLAVFVGTFTLAAAQAVTSDDALDESEIIHCVDSLVMKSLVSTVISSDGMPRYRLLETTRAYAMQKLDGAGETQAIARRHAQYFASLLGRIGRDITPTAAIPTHSNHLLGNVRSALEWCFADHASNTTAVRDPALAIDLATGAIPLLLGLSLLNECQKWSTAALALFDTSTRGGIKEMPLLEARAISSTWTLGNHTDARASIRRALEIGRTLGETPQRLRLLVVTHVFLLLSGDLQGSLAIAEEFAGALHEDRSTSYRLISDWMLGSSHHFMGNQAAAKTYFERAFARGGPLNIQPVGLDYRVRALVTFDRVLWLSGFPDRAIRIANEAIAEAQRLNSPLNICFSLGYTAPLFLWCGDLESAHDVLEQLMSHPNWHALPTLHATAFALKAELLIRRGEIDHGVSMLRSALITMRSDQQTLLLGRATCAFAEGLTAIGQFEEALAALNGTIEEVGSGGESVDLPEYLRLQAHVYLSMDEPDQSKAESCLTQALTVARRQSALAWELRIAMTMVRCQAKQGRSDDARQLLASTYGRFTEGFETADLTAARLLLQNLDNAMAQEAASKRSQIRRGPGSERLLLAADVAKARVEGPDTPPHSRVAPSGYAPLRGVGKEFS